MKILVGGIDVHDDFDVGICVLQRGGDGGGGGDVVLAGLRIIGNPAFCVRNFVVYFI
jgi:hypothetical protein